MSETITPATASVYWPSKWSYFDVYGPIQLGVGFNSLFLGLVWAGTYKYFDRYRDDKLRIKVFIGFLCLLTTVDTAMLWTLVLQLTYKPGDFIYALEVQAGHFGWARTIFSSTCAFLVQYYMIHTFFSFALKLRYQGSRHALLKKNLIRFSGFLLFLTALTGMIAAWVAPVYSKALVSDSNYNDLKKTQAVSFTWQLQYGAVLSVDIILTVVFSTYLHSVRTGFSSTNSVINALVIILLRNGLLVTSLQLATLLLYTLTSTYWIVFPAAFSSKLYVLTVLSLITKPRSVQSRSFEQTLKPPPGITRPLSGIVTENIAVATSSTISKGSGSNGSSTICQSCRSRVIPVTVTSANRRSHDDPIGSSGDNHSKGGLLSFTEFLGNGDNILEITPEEEEDKWLVDDNAENDLEKGLVKQKQQL
ncbi:uncharacterized protein L201_001151 [Kwoniella dendrophila CBS 6074]|uniref:DUF6534 domain-containing protein n=1 Tax=Kwoniella dendrophila CBS 6074 TaxID=1295534 RepID=A0AAX4JPA2_9TREE